MEVPHTETGAHPPDPGQNAGVRVCIDHVFSSPYFPASHRRSQLLRYILDRTLAGRADEITEYGIGLDVFQKPPSFDTRTEAVVRVEMNRLRRALADYYENSGSAEPWRIEFPKRGYIPAIVEHPAASVGMPAPPAALAREEVRSAQPNSRSLRWTVLFAFVPALITVGAWGLWNAASHTASIRSILVLPLENLTGDPQNEYLSDGLTEQLTDSLAHIPSFRVVARTSAFQLKGKGTDIRAIGRQLNVDAVVEGSLRKIDDRLRLTIRVNRTLDGFHIVSQTFDSGMSDLFRLENEMTLAVVAALRPGMSFASRKEPDPEAHDLYLRAQSYRGQATLDSFQQAIAYLDKAIERDPQYADAYAALAGVYASGAANLANEPLQFVPQAKAAAAKAIELDPFSGSAYAAIGFVDALVLMDWKKGERELRDAVRLMPESATAHNWLGITLMVQGSFPEAIPELRKAEELDPLAAGAGITVGLVYTMARRYDEAIAQLTKVQRLHPDAIMVHPFLGAAWEGKGDFTRAMNEYQLAAAKVPAQVKDRMAHLLACEGRNEEARALLAEIERPSAGEGPPDGLGIATVYAALGDRDRAFAWLTRAYESRRIALLKVHPFLDPLRDDLRFRELLKKTGLQ